MSRLVVIDADVLGRERTGDETYVANLLAALPGLTDEFRFAAKIEFPFYVDARLRRAPRGLRHFYPHN